MPRFLAIWLIATAPLIARSQEEVNVPENALSALFATQAASGRPMEYPPLVLGKMTEVGQVGLLDSNRVFKLGGSSEVSTSFKVQQKFEDGSGLVYANHNWYSEVSAMLSGVPISRPKHTTSTEGPFLLRGIDLSAKATDSIVELDGTFKITGVHTYQNVAGGTTSAFIVEPAKLMPVPRYPEAIRLEPRSWSDASGRFARQGTYVGYDKGKVSIELTEGKTIDVELSKLDTESQAYVRKQIKFEADYRKAQGSGGDARPKRRSRRASE
jgi:hypothetical protein